MTSNRDETRFPTYGNIPATVQMIKSMKRKNDSNPKQHDKEDLDFLDDRMQLLDTVREMIDIELERCGVCPEGSPHPENLPPEDIGRTPPDPPLRRSFWQWLMSIFTHCLL